MITKTEAEISLLGNIRNENYKSLIDWACSTVQKIWSSEV